MLRHSKMWLVLALLAVLLPARALAQDDPDEVPLGDVARSLRKGTAPPKQVIDDDNFSQVMKQVESRKSVGSALNFLMEDESRAAQARKPDVTCSLSFSINAKSMAPSQYVQRDMPAIDVEKLAGPATITGDDLTVAIFNGTDWHVSELAVALTVVRKSAATEQPALDEDAPKSTEAKMLMSPDAPPEKKPDTTVIYRMRAAAEPSATTVFSAPLTFNLDSGDEWHWAIVEAKGYPPQGYVPNGQETAADRGAADSGLPILPVQGTAAASLMPQAH
jgi:hypothetical protein